MNPLGYVNLYWLKEFVDWAEDSAHDWLSRRKEYRFDPWEETFFDVFSLSNQSSVELFYAKGLAPAFSRFNTFQQILILDALAMTMVVDSDEIWLRGINLRTASLYDREITLSDNPAELFLQFYDWLSSGRQHALSGYQNVEWTYDNQDTLRLYDHC
ncbi:hypothetical protein [Deinococcus sonorensis]|uniref:Uncharacterized protein n=2 Tax=Deinococcus sonorensis TaxID=309891 RepID=A0AAU7U906_9DEIO